ncbi:3'-phosphoesterase [Streptomyces phaeoluteigriseus]|uniref:3'-phosphoesterase n=1 Tax=Streptomyces phaeoluteigriseus TaxID=114686 RepID=A0A1V6MZE8_9ACTN|nr:DNA polymerase ligase N-terminal domain-containing protein [Streptomyces phaeoluteigriseus]OQD57801.1 3'-phosphoesterase [Streptomyces phaeoluteigriseus]
MGERERLGDHRGQRDVDRTGEPSGERAPAGDARPRFVVQIHDAGTLHFDFRLQVGDVLKSWSVPRGPSARPKDKRLAVPTGDHPLVHEDFEGVIAPDEYGGGTVIVWDRGTYEPLGPDAGFEEGLRRGHVSFRLHGAKLRGTYALTRFRGEDDWLLVKAGGGTGHGHGTPNPRRARSVATGRTLGQVAAGA